MGKKQSIRKGISLLAAGALVAGMLSGCGGKEDAAKTDVAAKSKEGSQSSESSSSKLEKVTYPVKDAGKFTYGMKLAGAWSDRYDSFDALPIGQELETRTGFDMDMVHVEGNQAMNLLLASGELPDVLAYNFQAFYNGGEEKAVQDGLIYPMSEDFVKENAPDYWKAISENPDILKQVKTSDGNIYGFAYIIGDEEAKGGYGLTLRDDWCEELGLDLPETADEFYDMLVAFKEKKGAEVPFCLKSDTLIEMLQRGIVTSPFGLVCADNYVDDGKVVIGYEQPEFKDVLSWMNKLYEEGLLDPNFSTIDDETVKANMLTGKAGASVGAVGGFMGNLLSTNKDVADYSLAGIKNLVSNKGDTPLYGHYNTDVVGIVTAITNSCKNPEDVAKFLNYGYTDEGHMLYNYGIEGKTYDMKDDDLKFSDLVLNNPDGLTPQQVTAEYAMSYTNGPFVSDSKYSYNEDERQTVAKKRFIDNDAKKYKLPRVTITAEDTGEYSSLVSELTTYRDEMIVKFVRGEESLDQYDNYVDTLKSMGVDRVKEILQGAVDEYNKR